MLLRRTIVVKSYSLLFSYGRQGTLPSIDTDILDQTRSSQSSLVEMEMAASSSSGGSCSSSTCFDLALGYLNWLEHRFSLDMENRYLGFFKSFLLCAREWRRSNHFSLEYEEDGSHECLGCISVKVLRLVHTITEYIHSVYLESGTLVPDDPLAEARVFWRSINLLGMYIEGFFIELFWKPDRYIDLDPDSRRSLILRDLIDYLLNVIDSLLTRNVRNAFWISRFNGLSLRDELKSLKEKLMFLRNIICFATMLLQGGVELMRLIIHGEEAAVKVASLIFLPWFCFEHEPVSSNMQFGISQPITVYPKVGELYIHVLTASKLSRSSSSPEFLWHMLANFINSLLGNIWKLLACDTAGFIIRVHDQLQVLFQGLKSLRMLLREQPEKFTKLPDIMKDLVRVVICDAGIVICSLPVDQMKEGLSKETDIALFHLLEDLKFILAEVAQTYMRTSSSSYNFPKTNELGYTDFLLKKLRELASCETNSVASVDNKIHTILEDLIFLRSFLDKIVQQRNKNEKLQALWSRVMEVAYKAVFVKESMLVGHKPDCSPLSLDSISEEIKFIKTEALKIYDSVSHNNQDERVTKAFVHMPSRVSTPALRVLVGLDEEVKKIVAGLTRGLKQLDVVSIVGMPGLGKTTLANRVYNDPSITYHFHICAWCTVSQVYNKHSLLLQILDDIVSESSKKYAEMNENDLGDIVSESPKKYPEMNENDLAEELYKRLKGNRYLIVLDDVWDIGAWNLLNVSLPDDTNGSRILFTSRFRNLSSQFKLGSMPYDLRPLTNEESWALLQSRIFGKEGCPPALNVVGMQIAKNCKGLPLTIVVVAGILSSIEPDCWEEVVESLSSNTVVETEYCMKTLDLSYRHLPDHLKPCLLYFGAFLEGQDIPARKLKLLWIAEGFVQKTEVKSLEDVADEFLMDLIDRSLVMVIQERSVGGVKACRVHDLVHEYCVAKAKEESFLEILHRFNEFSTFTRSCNTDRLCINFTTVDESRKSDELKESSLFFPHLRSLLFFGARDWSSVGSDKDLFPFRMLKLLTVLDLENIDFGQCFPREVELLVHLIYLAIQCQPYSIPSSITNLSRLETFIIRVWDEHVKLPYTVWNMTKLRHLDLQSTYFRVGFSFPIDNLEASPDLCHLTTCSLVIDPFSQSLQQILTKLPSIRRLKCVGRQSGESTGSCKRIIELDFLSRLESLHLVGFCGAKFAFPKNLKKLTLTSYKQSWSEISTIGKLPNLAVLKLRKNSFVGDTWEIKGGEFPNLRFLGLYVSDIVVWTASCDNFPPLQKLVLHYCTKLKGLPSALGDIPTIELIKVKYCNESAVDLVKQIQQQQMDMGYEGLKIVIDSQ